MAIVGSVAGAGVQRAVHRGEWVLPARVVIMAALGATILFRTSLNLVDLDIWHQMALARVILASGQVPTVDQFAYTPTVTPFIHHEWGAGIIAYLVLKQFGPLAILLLKYVLLGATVTACIWYAVRRGGGPENWDWFALPALWMLGIAYVPVRAQAYTLLFVALLFGCLQRDEEGDKRWIGLFLLVFPIWVNLHGGCALGILLVGVQWFERLLHRRRCIHLPAIIASMLLLLLLNPYGSAYPRYLWHALTMPRPHISEWQPIWVDGLQSLAYVVCASAAGYVAIAAGVRRSLPPLGIGTVLFTAVIAALHIKLSPVFALATLCYMPGLLRGTRLGSRLAEFNTNWHDLAAATWLMWLVVVVAVASTNARYWNLTIPGKPLSNCRLRITYPTGAADYLREHRFTGNLMTPFDYGAYVTWRLYPAVRVSMDSRYEAVYSERLFSQISDFYGSRPGWRATLSAYGTDAVLVRVTDPVAAAMADTDWARVYSDSQFQVYVRPGLRLPIISRPGPVPDGTLQ